VVAVSFATNGWAFVLVMVMIVLSAILPIVYFKRKRLL
jgi:Mg2+ and Co2+ transporter CorA